MSLIEKTIILGVRCEKRSCTARLTGPEKLLWAHGEQSGRAYYETLAVSQGWTIWVGRSRVHYCPDHKPARGSRMRQAWATS